MWGGSFQDVILGSYDTIVDETWSGNTRHRLRLPAEAAEEAVQSTIAAAEFLSKVRDTVPDHTLLLSVQGITRAQYLECALKVLKYVKPGVDWLGLGSWCLVGNAPSTLFPLFRDVIPDVLGLASEHGVHHIHIHGVLHRATLALLRYYCNNLLIPEVSTDSSSPIRQSGFGQRWKHAGALKPYWRDNVDAWVALLNSF